MVKICPNEYTNSDSSEMNQHFEGFPFELSPFQKYAIEGIVTGNHVITTAHTGSGKTLSAEFAIKYFLSQGKKVIYTSPIKALSNQKFKDFHKLTSDIGILTGDIKVNSEASLLVMTTEILCNTLYCKRNNISSSSMLLDFDMDFENELACVIFDEIHYINDPERGRVWEESIMMLPKNVQIIGLSATIDNPEGFCQWIENKYTDKIVYLASTNHRIVPLTHYGFITAPDNIQNMKHLSKEEKALVKNRINKTYVIQDSSNVFNDSSYKTIYDTINLLLDKQIYVKPQYVLNQVCQHLVDTENLPALCFVLSRNKLEEYANQITTNLLEFDSKVPYIAKRECDKLLRDKLPNCEEYFNLPEYINMVKLMEKGIAIHHSGCLPVLKEIVEILYDRGFIKLLFATETFSIGINMPTKTVIFTNIKKFDGSINRNLYSHEYTQMAGRAGRRGIDTVGNVIHLNNLFDIELSNYKTVLSGIPQKLSSKFKISYNLLLNLIQSSSTNIVDYIKKSMITDDLNKNLSQVTNKLASAKGIMSANAPLFLTPIESLDIYVNLYNSLNSVNGNKRKKVLSELDTMKKSFKNISLDYDNKLKHDVKLKEIEELDSQLNDINKYFDIRVDIILSFLKEEGFIDENNDLTAIGKTASIIKELNCLAFSKIIHSEVLNTLTPIQLVGLFSCFTELKVHDDMKISNPDSEDDKLCDIITLISKEYEYYQSREQFNTGTKYNMMYDIIDDSIRWCQCENYIECYEIIADLAYKGIFLGEFSKAMLKVNNIANELIKVAKSINNVELEHKLSQIPSLTLKFVICNQSLYL
jgi:superfamily II RNA helicase